MITVKIHYGLGNQLFQFAFAKSLFHKTGKIVLLDNSFYINNQQEEHPRVFGLDNFNINLKIINADKITPKKLWSEKFLNKLSRIVFPYYRQSIVFEKELTYDKNMWDVKEGSYLIGYWQDERYFKDIEEIIRKDLSFKKPPKKHNEVLFSELINSKNTVCIHVRRGDYITLKYADIVGACSMEYYIKAFEEMRKIVKEPKVYVFSDEPEWVSLNFNIKYPVTIVFNNKEIDAIEDLRLMSICNHQIISNSSFGWWAAWLNPNPNKVVIAPKVWRKNGPDIYTPESWLRI